MAVPYLFGADTRKAIATYFKVHYSAVSQAAKKAEPAADDVVSVASNMLVKSNALCCQAVIAKTVMVLIPHSAFRI